MDTPKFNMKKWVLMLAIAIVFNLFVNYGLSTVYKSPDMKDYCNGTDQYRPYAYPAEKFPPGNVVNTNVTCPQYTINATMQRNCNAQGGQVMFNTDEKDCANGAYCEMCYKLFDDDKRKYDANIFIILVAIGAAAIIGGIFMAVESVGGGFLLGGILSIIVGAIRSWANLHEWLRLLFLGLALGLLIFVGYKKIK